MCAWQDLSCTGGDSVSVYGPGSPAGALLFSGCRADQTPFAVSAPVTSDTVNVTVVLSSTASFGSGVGQGWLVSLVRLRHLRAAQC